VWPEEGHCEKNMKSKLVAKNGCDGRLMVKISIMTIQVNFGAKSMEKKHKFKIYTITAISLLPPWIAHLFSQ